MDSSGIRQHTFLTSLTAFMIAGGLFLWIPDPPPTARGQRLPRERGGVPIGRFPYQYQIDKYDWNDAQDKMEAIGRAIQEYRKIHQPKQIAQRRNRVDAGLPQTHDEYVSLFPRSARFLKNSPGQPPRFPPGRSTDFSILPYGFKLWFEPHEEAELWRKRGEDVPVLYDGAQYTPEAMKSAWAQKLELPTLVLRLDGRVEKTTWRLTGKSGQEKFNIWNR